MRIPILTYQPMRIDGNDYRSNDLCAMDEDLVHLTRAGFRIMPLRSIVDAWLDTPAPELDEKVVALTSDNGADFDFADLAHPRAGQQRSVLTVLRRFAGGEGVVQERLNVTSFVIASPEAREILDRTCMVGRGWWRDDWWPEAAQTGLMHIGNHSWDHNHETLPPDFGLPMRRGTFATIDSIERAEYEIRRSAEYLTALAPNPGAGLFAYPYGESNSYLVHEYFPAHGDDVGIRAAFTSAPGFLERGTGRWEIPRFVFGRDWTSPGELDSILEASTTRRAWVPVSAPPRNDAIPGKDHPLRIAGEFIAARVERIPGWMVHEAALLTIHLAAAQDRLGVTGPTLEIGVYKGKYLAVLYKASDPAEPVVGIDLFVGSSNKLHDIAEVQARIAAACGDAARLKLLAADSTELTAEELLGQAGARKFRFISVDGGHAADVVSHDLQVSHAALADGGIIAIDDIFNPLVPGVMEGVSRYFIGGRPALAPFAYCSNKLFVTTPGFHERYLAAALSFLGEVAWLRTQERTLQVLRENRANGFAPKLFGYEIVTFEP